MYAKIKPATSSSDGDDNVLQKVADKIVEKFVATGLMRRQYDRVKLHVTVMNTKFKRTFQEQNEKSTQNSASDENNLKKDAGSTTREKIDAREILNRFGDRHFSTTHINEMHLSQLKTGRRARTGRTNPHRFNKTQQTEHSPAQAHTLPTSTSPVKLFSLNQNADWVGRS